MLRGAARDARNARAQRSPLASAPAGAASARRAPRRRGSKFGARANTPHSAAKMTSLARSRLTEERREWRTDHPFGFYARPSKAADGAFVRSRGSLGSCCGRLRCAACAARASPTRARPRRCLSPPGSMNMMFWEAGIPGKEGTSWAGATYKVTLECVCASRVRRWRCCIAARSAGLPRRGVARLAGAQSWADGCRWLGAGLLCRAMACAGAAGGGCGAAAAATRAGGGAWSQRRRRRNGRRGGLLRVI